MYVRLNTIKKEMVNNITLIYYSHLVSRKKMKTRDSIVLIREYINVLFSHSCGQQDIWAWSYLHLEYRYITLNLCLVLLEYDSIMQDRVSSQTCTWGVSSSTIFLLLSNSVGALTHMADNRKKKQQS